MFIGKFGVLYFLVKPVLRIALLPHYRRNLTIVISDSNCMSLTWTLLHLILFLKISLLTRSSLPAVFCKNGILKNFKKFTGKHVCQSFFFNKFADFRLVFVRDQKTISNKKNQDKKMTSSLSN